jgi:glycosyltransferase involved in cell wall biosynthesis
MPLKIAGQIQPRDREYFAREIKPHLDGNFIEYVGEVDLAAKNDLLGNSSAMLFPIRWNEPFGLVMIEAMACGTPVLASSGGSVAEVVRPGISGYVCSSVQQLVTSVQQLPALAPANIRKYVERHFSSASMARAYLQTYRESIGEHLHAKTDGVCPRPAESVALESECSVTSSADSAL